MAKSDVHNHYNRGLSHFLINQNAPAYKRAMDRSAYNAIGDFVEQKLRPKMDKKRVEKIIFVLDDPLQEYGHDLLLIKKALQSFLPHIKKILHIDKNNPLLPKMQSIKNIDPTQIDRLISQWYTLYTTKAMMA